MYNASRSCSLDTRYLRFATLFCILAQYSVPPVAVIPGQLRNIVGQFTTRPYKNWRGKYFDTAFAFKNIPLELGLLRTRKHTQAHASTRMHTLRLVLSRLSPAVKCGSHFGSAAADTLADERHALQRLRLGRKRLVQL